jgi:outer membrane lipoprotein SlyB
MKLKILSGALLALSLSVTAAPPVGSVSNPNTCANCGTVKAIDPVKHKGSATGAGAVIGAVAGAVIGHQVGSGRGNDAATATGAVAGGVAGHQIEKRKNGETFYRVTVLMDSGDSRTIDVADLNGLSTGAKVKVVGNNIQMAG